MSIKKNDIILIISLLVFAAAIILIVFLSRTGGAYAVVTVDGTEVGRYPLSDDITVKIGDDDYNVLTIQDGYADVTDASCPDKLCVDQRKIKYDGETIVCLPNRLVVEIVGGVSASADAVSQ